MPNSSSSIAVRNRTLMWVRAEIAGRNLLERDPTGLSLVSQALSEVAIRRKHHSNYSTVPSLNGTSNDELHDINVEE